MKSPKASVVIPTFKRGSMALNLATQIRKFYPSIEIVIVDQENQTPPSGQLITKLKVKYFNLDKANSSIAKNKGIRESTGQIIIFFDDDVEITKATIPSHLGAYNDSSIVGVAGRVINDFETVPDKTDVKTGESNFLGTKFTYRFWSTKKQSVDFVYGCNMSFRKSALNKIGGFDEKFPKIFEEVDLSKRIRKLGNIVFEPKALVYHHKAKSGGIRKEESINKQKFIFANYGRYLAKNIPFPVSLISLLLRVKTAFSQSPSVPGALISNYGKTLIERAIGFIKGNWLWLLVFSVLAVIKLWRAVDFFSFNFDEEYQATLAWQQVKDFHPIWIGVSASNFYYYLGPAFTYLNALLFYLSKGDPVSLAYFAPLFGIVTMASVYYVTKNLFSKNTALIAMILYGGSALINFYDRRFWNPTPIMFISLWMIYSLVKSFKDSRWLILTAILYAISFHIHLSLMLIIPIIFITVVLNLKKISLKTWIMMIASYLIITSPMLVFDVVHNFDNMKAPFRFFTSSDLPEHSITAPGLEWHKQIYMSTLGRFWYVNSKTNIQDEQTLGQHVAQTPGKLVFAILSLIAIAYMLLKARSSLAARYIIATIFIYSASFILYPGAAAEYYMLGMFVLMPIVFAHLFSKLPTLLTVIALAVFVFFNAMTIFNLNQDLYGLSTRKQIVSRAMEAVGDKPYSVETYGEDNRKYHPYGGWRYLFRIYGRVPAQSFADEFFGWIYPDEISTVKPEVRVVVSEDVPYENATKSVSEFKVGGYYTYVIPVEQK